MDPIDRRLVLGVLNDPTSSIVCARDLLDCLRRECIFTDAAVDQHMEEILRIWKGRKQQGKQQDVLSPPASNPGERKDDADSDGRLALYGPVDEQADKDPVSLFRPDRGIFGYANSRRSEGHMSFIQAKTVKDNRLEPDDDGTVVIQWKSSVFAGGDDSVDCHDETARNTCCIVLGPDDVAQVGMTVDIVFGTRCVADLDEQRMNIPPPRCPTPPGAPPSDIDQPDASMSSSFGDADGATQQVVPTQHSGIYSPVSQSARPASYITATNVFFLGSPDQLGWAAQLGSSMENLGVTPGAGPSVAPMGGTPAMGGSKRKADGNAQGIGRAKKLHS
ncbi:hypothetical protein Daus18300_013017 [Diaporthe australafricana]|uniref:Uncharacterized protein n=1 Tax=Diaporthe australafricana TaxID=127596 RepID=A0ABR3W0J6_9PEZI